jgi:apolipoprotein D and lipocalin family protein
MRYFLCVLIFAVTGCVGVPEGIEPVGGFDKTRYLGKWYEIARLDHSFERGMERVSAEYSLRDDGGINVINRGFDSQSRQWDEAHAKAFFVDDPQLAHLKVSFFGPFYGSYVIFELDKNYQYAFVTSSNKSYLWLLSRSPQVGDKLKQHFLAAVAALGFDQTAIIFVDQHFDDNNGEYVVPDE